MDQYVRLVGSIRKNASEERDIKIVRMVGSIRTKRSEERSAKYVRLEGSMRTRGWTHSSSLTEVAVS